MANKFDTFVYYACGILSFDKHELSSDTLLDLCAQFGESYNRIGKYYFIWHDDAETHHIHFVFYLNAQCRLLTIFNKLREFFVNKNKVIRKDEGISLEKCVSINAYLRYMLHVDGDSQSQHKKVYSIDDIVSNDELSNIETLINSKKGEVDAYYLRNVVLDSSDDFQIMVKLGLKLYHRYRYEIEIIKDNRITLKAQREQEHGEDLPF